MNEKDVSRRTDLSKEDVGVLLDVSKILPMIADLIGGDVFIDCMQQEDQKLYVAAQSGPKDISSVYLSQVEGFTAEPENEPAIYRAMETGVPMRDIKAVTQEEKIVSQNAVPIFNDTDDVIGVLIAERDISAELQREQKYRAFEQRTERSLMEDMEDGHYRIQELYHRVKNHLQMIMSIMNLQAKKCSNPEVRDILSENVSRMLNLSSIYELFMSGDSDQISLKQYLEKLRLNISSMNQKEKMIEIVLEGEDIIVPQSKVTDIAIVVNELVTNAYKHAFSGRTRGTIKIVLKKGDEFSAIVIQDDGIGITGGGDKSNEKSMGMTLVKMIVREKLNGKVYLDSGSHGTTATFDFII